MIELIPQYNLLIAYGIKVLIDKFGFILVHEAEYIWKLIGIVKVLTRNSLKCAPLFHVVFRTNCV